MGGNGFIAMLLSSSHMEQSKDEDWKNVFLLDMEGEMLQFSAE